MQVKMLPVGQRTMLQAKAWGDYEPGGEQNPDLAMYRWRVCGTDSHAPCGFCSRPRVPVS